MSGRRGLLVDYGGVLTTPIAEAARAFCDSTGVPADTLSAVIAEAYAGDDGHGPVEQLERGLVTEEAFGALLARELERRCGVALDGSAVLARIFAPLALDERMLAGVALARGHGVRTALVSNSWGVGGYPRDRLEPLFDALVLSGEVGVRKPDPAIFEHALAALGLRSGACVFVDDIPGNVAAAEALGMQGVVHREAGRTLRRVAELLGLAEDALQPAPSPGDVPA